MKPISISIMILCGLFLLAADQTMLADRTRIGRGVAKEHQVAKLNRIINAEYAQRKVMLARVCSDAVFCRRVFMDLIGTMPTPDEVRKFLASDDRNKRAKLIDSLLERDEFAIYWTLKWCDHLRVKSEFPINLWPNGVAAYHTWVLHALEKNMPYDQFARELLTSSGSNFRVPQVNFYRAMQQRTPEGIAGAVSLTFMGTKFENLTVTQQKNLAACFTKVRYKSTVEWKEQIIYNDPAPGKLTELVMPDGQKRKLGQFDDPRKVFADWLIRNRNEWFARAAVNRIWAWMFGRGMIYPASNCSPRNPATYPKLMDYLVKQFVKSGYDSKVVYRLIANSRVYQQASKPAEPAKRAELMFACYPIRRHDAEVLIDAINYITDSHENYTSIIPEPFTLIPPTNRTIELADGSITSEFLEMFGRPSRDTGLLSERNNKSSISQQLYLLNSTTLANKVRKSKKLKAILSAKKKSPVDKVNELYLLILSRYPTKDELVILKSHMQAKKGGRARYQAVEDVIWALMNTKEFLYRH